jgi:Fe-Mn family superoxide dismutase
MVYEAKKFDNLLGLEGFSDRALKNHFTLYEGYVTNVNKEVDSIVKLLDEDKTATPEFAEVQRRFGWEFNGMRLHEIYFAGMVKGGSKFEAETEFGKKLLKEFGSFERWEKHFRATAAMRGIGWVILYADDVTGTMYNVWINEHDEGHMAGATPLIAMDVFEHAYMIDYDTKRAGYIDAFIKAIDWKVAKERFDAKK